MYIFLFLILLFFFFGFFLLMSILGGVRSIFKRGHKNVDASTHQTKTKVKEKFFKSDQGEYVDYEEIKEEK